MAQYIISIIIIIIIIIIYWIIITEALTCKQRFNVIGHSWFKVEFELRYLLLESFIYNNVIIF